MRKGLLLLLFQFFLLEGGAQQLSKVDFKHLKADLGFELTEKKIFGALKFTFDVLQETDSIFIDAKKMEIENVSLNGGETEMYNDGNRLWILSDFKESRDNILSFEYSAIPDQALYFVGWDQVTVNKGLEPQIWTQGQGKYTSNWLPSFDDTNEKLEFDLCVEFEKGYTVIANGQKANAYEVDQEFTRWEFDMENPMSSYLVALAVGKYYWKEVKSSSGIPIELYFYQDQEEKVEPTYRYTVEMFDFLEKEIGVPYPWQNYKQVPVRDFLYSGMENTGTTIFSDFLVTDSIGFMDRNYVMVNAHELAHQWFGNLVTAAGREDHWLQEGFSTYFALLAEREIFGEEYYYWKLFESANHLKDLSDKGKGEAVVSPRASSLTYYQKGAWALHILKERLGEKAFREGMSNFLNKYRFKNASTQDFIEEMVAASGINLDEYVSEWLEQSSFQGTQAYESLQRSDFIMDYFEIASLKGIPMKNKKEMLLKELGRKNINRYIGQEVIFQLALEDPVDVIDLYKAAFGSGNDFVRQALAISLQEIPRQLKKEYETLLNDNSYQTKEAAFYHLWINFPQDRMKYLEKMKGMVGFSDKNLRILWLALHLATPDYNSGDQDKIYGELSGYTSPAYPFYVRQNAFDYLYQLNSFSRQNLLDLMEGSQHQVSRFNNFSRGMIKELLKSKVYRDRFKGVEDELTNGQKAYLNHLLK